MRVLRLVALGLLPFAAGCWIERPNLDPQRGALTEQVYVCLDPRTGLVDLKSKE